MKCINCNRKVNEGIGYYNTDCGPLCIICHDLEIEANTLTLLKKAQKSSHQNALNKENGTIS
jgi:hypothetical protein